MSVLTVATQVALVAVVIGALSGLVWIVWKGPRIEIEMLGLAEHADYTTADFVVTGTRLTRGEAASFAHGLASDHHKDFAWGAPFQTEYHAVPGGWLVVLTRWHTDPYLLGERP